jgi:hypothetical protein
MTLPDLRGYELERQICSTANRIIVLWFSKLDPEAGLWRQIQVSLVSARLSMASVEIAEGFPPLRSYKVAEKSTPRGDRIELSLYFDAGELSFECETATCSEYARKITSIRSSET